MTTRSIRAAKGNLVLRNKRTRRTIRQPRTNLLQAELGRRQHRAREEEEAIVPPKEEEPGTQTYNNITIDVPLLLYVGSIMAHTTT